MKLAFERPKKPAHSKPQPIETIDPQPIALELAEQPVQDGMMSTPQPKPKGKQLIQPKPHIISQSIALLPGRLEPIEGKLHLLCPDKTRLPVSGIDSSFAVWLFSHLVTVGSDQNWLCYPRSIDGCLQVFLKGVNPKRFDLEPDHCCIVGKVLGIRENSLLIGIRRNIDRRSFEKLQKNGIVKMTPQLQSFAVIVVGHHPEIEVGQVWQTTCVRKSNDLVIIDAQRQD